MKVLVVDDSKAMRRLLSAWCDALQFQIATAVDGRDGLQKISTSGPFDLVLLDWDMPGMNGIEMLKEVRNDSQNSQTKILMVTAHNDMNSVKNAIQEGASDFLMKPLTEEMLADKIRLLGLI